jgi:DnaK suppressor protein
VTIDVDHVKQKLLRERERLLASRERLLEDTSRSLEDATDEDGNDSHLADSASETVEREIELSLEDSAEHLLAGIDAALDRLAAGSYGLCERCGRPIAAERLAELPSATKCIDCKWHEERS